MTVPEIAIEYLAIGGKRLRPRLCRAVYDSLIKPGAAGRIESVMEAIECFHKASLVHDDIQDGDEFRYGVPTVWKAHGVAVAIAVGDWLVAHGYELIAESGFVRVSEMLRMTVKSHLRLCEGQGDELVGGGSYLLNCERKTGEAFALAASLGAMAAECNPEPYREWGMTYGVIFQIDDDAADGEADPEGGARRAEFVRKLHDMPVGPFL